MGINLTKNGSTNLRLRKPNLKWENSENFQKNDIVGSVIGLKAQKFHWNFRILGSQPIKNCKNGQLIN